jgi:hypothetical protein
MGCWLWEIWRAEGLDMRFYGEIRGKNLWGRRGLPLPKPTLAAIRLRLGWGTRLIDAPILEYKNLTAA